MYTYHKNIYLYMSEIWHCSVKVVIDDVQDINKCDMSRVKWYFAENVLHVICFVMLYATIAKSQLFAKIRMKIMRENFHSTFCLYILNQWRQMSNDGRRLQKLFTGSGYHDQLYYVPGLLWWSKNLTRPQIFFEWNVSIKSIYKSWASHTFYLSISKI